MAVDSMRHKKKLQDTYNLLVQSLSDHPEKGWIEPFDHVWEVERLRIQQRPKHIRLLLIAESHVRVPNTRPQGVGFVYEPRYYTPWWGDLFLPGFGATFHHTTPDIRQDCLAAMRDAEFWVLDASIIALSGYQRKGVGYTKPRPFDNVKQQIMLLSWENYFKEHYYCAMNQTERPFVVAYHLLSTFIPDIHTDIPFKFRNASNTHQYRTEKYEGGTWDFIEAAVVTDRHSSLRNIDVKNPRLAKAGQRQSQK